MRVYVKIFLPFILLLSCGTDKKNNNRGDIPASDTTPSGDNADANSIVPKKIVFLNPGPASVGDELLITIQIQDNDGNIASKTDGEVHLNVGGSATHPNVVPITAGIGKIGITDGIAEAVRLNFVDSEPKGLDISNTLNIAFIHDDAAKMVIDSIKNPAAGILLSVTILAQDKFGNTDSGYTGTVTLVATGSAQVEGLVTLKDGKGIGKVFATKAEDVTLSLDDQGKSGLNVKSTKTYTVVPSHPTKYVMQPIADTKVMVAVNIEVQVQDSLGNVVSDYNGEVTVNASSGNVAGDGLMTITGGKGTISVTNSVAEPVAFTMTDGNSTGFATNFRSMDFIP